ncbi:MAG: response regulator [Nitrososphaerales archaeon]
MKIPIAEDERDIAQAYSIILRTRNHEVMVAHDGEQCLKVYKDELNRVSMINGRSPFDVVVLDYRMPKKDGLEVAREILSMDPHQTIIFATAYGKENLSDVVKDLKQFVGLLQKPFELALLVDAKVKRNAIENTADN